MISLASRLSIYHLKVGFNFTSGLSAINNSYDPPTETGNSVFFWKKKNRHCRSVKAEAEVLIPLVKRNTAFWMRWTLPFPRRRIVRCRKKQVTRYFLIALPDYQFAIPAMANGNLGIGGGGANGLWLWTADLVSSLCGFRAQSASYRNVHCPRWLPRRWPTKQNSKQLRTHWIARQKKPTRNESSDDISFFGWKENRSNRGKSTLKNFNST